MKTKIPILIAISLFIATVTKAQYGAPCADNRIVVRGQFALPGQAVISYDYNHSVRDRYADQRDWREAEYNRYCHESRGYRMSREEYYRTRCDHRARPYFAPQRVVLYRY